MFAYCAFVFTKKNRHFGLRKPYCFIFKAYIYFNITFLILVYEKL